MTLAPATSTPGDTTTITLTGTMATSGVNSAVTGKTVSLCHDRDPVCATDTAVQRLEGSALLGGFTFGAAFATSFDPHTNYSLDELAAVAYSTSTRWDASLG